MDLRSSHRASTRSHRQRRRTWLAWPEGVSPGRAFFPVAFAVLALLPTEWLTRLPPVCVFRTFFGVQCPTCGLTRAFSSVLHGHFHIAWDYNHMVVIFFPVLA